MTTFEGDNSGREYTNPHWRHGSTAFIAGKRLDENPHPWGSTDYECWAQGWSEQMTKDAGLAAKVTK